MTSKTENAHKTSRQFAIQAAQIAHSKRAEDLIVLEVGERIKIAEYFVICTARNRRQVQTIVDEIDRSAKLSGRHPRMGIEGYAEARWVLLDFQDVIIHVFLDTVRTHYDLELLWGDSPRLSWNTEPGETSSDSRDDSPPPPEQNSPPDTQS